MLRTRQQIDSMLERLEDSIPALMQTYAEDAFMEAFSGNADRIREAASPADRAYVSARIDSMLASRGLIPGDNEGKRHA